jgi:16S rRNA (adenine1518-N6/adenine1519-N6)-dimethyltransferase
VVRAKKFLGQHFLKNQVVAERIVNALKGDENGNVLEIGPGTGVLTRLLVSKYPDLEVVELDRESVVYLVSHGIVDHSKVHQADFLALNLGRAF